MHTTKRNQQKIYFNLILPATPRSCELSFSFRLSNQNFVRIYPMRATCPTYLILFYLIILMISGGEYKLWSTPLGNFLELHPIPPGIPFLLGLNFS
jgi:hypothetical protein